MDRAQLCDHELLKVLEDDDCSWFEDAEREDVRVVARRGLVGRDLVSAGSSLIWLNTGRGHSQSTCRAKQDSVGRLLRHARRAKGVRTGT